MSLSPVLTKLAELQAGLLTMTAIASQNPNIPVGAFLEELTSCSNITTQLALGAIAAEAAVEAEQAAKAQPSFSKN